MEQELKIWESQQERQARLARSRAAARGRGYSWQETLRRTWRSIKKVVWANSGSRRIPHAAPPREVPQRRKEAANVSSGAHHIATGGAGSAEGAWDWKQASKDLRKQHEDDMMQRRRAGASTALWREEFESKVRPFSDSMSILTTHVDGRLRSAPCGNTPQDVYDAVSEQSEADEEEAIAATEAHVASDAHVEICVDEHELAGISLDLPVMAMLLEREKVEAALISLRHLLLTPSTPQSSLILADQLHKMSCPISASPCLAAGPLRATKLSGAKKDSAGNMHDACIGRHSADGSAAIPGSLQTSTRFHVNVGGALLLNQSVFRYTLNETLIRLQQYHTGTSPIPIRTPHASISMSTYAGIYELIRQLAPIAIEPFCISDVFNWKAAILSSSGQLMWVRRLHTHALLGSRLAARLRHLTPTGITEIDAHLALMWHVGVPTRSDELGEWRSAVDLVCAQGWHPSSPHLLPSSPHLLPSSPHLLPSSPHLLQLPHTDKDEAIAATYPPPPQVLALAHTRGPCARASPPEEVQKCEVEQMDDRESLHQDVVEHHNLEAEEEDGSEQENLEVEGQERLHQDQEVDNLEVEEQDNESVEEEENLILTNLTADGSVMKVVGVMGYGGAASWGHVAAIRICVSRIHLVPSHRKAHKLVHQDGLADQEKIVDEADQDMVDEVQGREHEEQGAFQDRPLEELSHGCEDDVFGGDGASTLLHRTHTKLLLKRDAGDAPLLYQLPSLEQDVTNGDATKACAEQHMSNANATAHALLHFDLRLQHDYCGLSANVKNALVGLLDVGVKSMTVGEVASFFTDLLENSEDAEQGGDVSRGDVATCSHLSAPSHLPTPLPPHVPSSRDVLPTHLPSISHVPTSIAHASTSSQLPTPQHAHSSGEGLEHKSKMCIRADCLTRMRSMLQVEVELLALNMLPLTTDGGVLAEIEHLADIDDCMGSGQHHSISSAQPSKLSNTSINSVIKSSTSRNAGSSREGKEGGGLGIASGLGLAGMASGLGLARIGIQASVGIKPQPKPGDIAVISYSLSYRGEVLMNLSEAHEVRLSEAVSLCRLGRDHSRAADSPDEPAAPATCAHEPDTDFPPGLQLLLVEHMFKGSVAKASLDGTYALTADYHDSLLLQCGERLEVELRLIDWHAVYAANVHASVNVTEMRQGSRMPRNNTEAVCSDGARVQLRLHAYCHDVGVPGMPFPPGMKLPKAIRDKQQQPLWKDAYGIRMPEDLAALYDRMAEGLGIFHGVQVLSAIIGDGELPAGLEVGLCARGLYSGREAKIDVSPEMATRLLIPDPPSASKQEARTNPFPVTYLVKVLSVEPLEHRPRRECIASAMLRRRRANAKYAGALSLLSSPTSSKCEVEESARLLQEACLLYKAAIHMARVTHLAPHHVPAPTNVTCLVQQQAHETQVACLLNMAATYARLDRQLEVVDACNEVLRIAPCNRKALVRKRRALDMLSAAASS